ncbi:MULTISPECIES: hypothetical protein [Nocardia]|uniref:hypothetical protein n=1 Tax=Nocardia TaxID=1817 RepID=UPI00245572A9|nr:MULTISPECIES: hypothetical protein [Nocardia]
MQPSPPDPHRGTYADEVRIVHRQVEQRGHHPIREFEMVIRPHGTIDLDWLAEQIKEAHREFDPEENRSVQRDSYDMRQTRIHGSWGADAHTVQFVIETTASFIRDNATFVATAGGTLLLEHGWQKVFDRLKALGYDVRYGRVAQLPDSEAELQGLWLIVREYDIALDALTPRSVSHDEANQSYSVTAAGPDSSLYTVVFTVRGSSAQLLHRTHEHGPAGTT